MSSHAAPVDRPVNTRAFRFFLLLTIVGFVLIAWRFAVGLGASTAMNDGYPWGLWIAFDVVTGTALACGGYAVALLVYVLNQNRYHPLIRPAILTSALGYSMGGLAVAIDVGRPWLMWKIPIRFWNWNLNSAQLEVALCIMAYCIVLWLEMAPPFLEKGSESKNSTLRNLSRKLTPVFEKLFLPIAALGVLLPTMHQSSLGTMMLLAGHKLHPLYFSPLVPLLFLIGCLGLGYAVVVFESALASRFFHRKPEMAMLASLGKVVPWTLFGFLAVRFADVIIRGVFGMAFQPTLPALMFWVEAVLFLLPALMLMSARGRSTLRALFRASLLVIVAGSLYRLDTYLVAYNPGEQWSYFPSMVELLVTVGVISFEVILYLWIVKKFPILGGMRAAESAS